MRQFFFYPGAKERGAQPLYMQHEGCYQLVAIVFLVLYVLVLYHFHMVHTFRENIEEVKKCQATLQHVQSASVHAHCAASPPAGTGAPSNHVGAANRRMGGVP